MILFESTHKTKDKIGLLLAKSTLTKYGNINRINTICMLVEEETIPIGLQVTRRKTKFLSTLVT